MPLDLADELTEQLTRLARIRPVFHSEADFQHALAWAFGQIGSFRVRLEYKAVPDERSYTDIWLLADSGPIALELKYLTKALDVEIEGERFVLANQAAQDISRYDVVKDVTRVERLVDSDLASAGAVVVITNDGGYWRRSERETIDRQFRIHDGRVLEGNLSWSDRAGDGTTRGRREALNVRGPYTLQWENYSLPIEGHPGGHFRSLIVSVPGRSG